MNTRRLLVSAILACGVALAAGCANHRAPLAAAPGASTDATSSATATASVSASSAAPSPEAGATSTTKGAPTPAAPATTPPATTPNEKDLERAVHQDAIQIMAEISQAEKRDPTLATKSNPYDYVAHAPTLKRLEALGTPALDAIAHEIESSPDDGLREYLLATAGASILGSSSSGHDWSTGKGWAALYRAKR